MLLVVHDILLAIAAVIEDSTGLDQMRQCKILLVIEQILLVDFRQSGKCCWQSSNFYWQMPTLCWQKTASYW